jgi:hypothetical protein
MIRRLFPVAVLALAVPASAQVDLHGFAESATGIRTTDSPLHEGGDWMLSETRTQLRAQAYGDVGEAFVRLDILHDQVGGENTDVELREGFLRFGLGPSIDVKAGRQALTWGTGDLVFVNDLFPKDWESFFAGRDDQYLKAPSDALRLGIFGLPFNTEVVLAPRFTADRLPAPGGRFSIPSPGPGAPAVLEREPKVENGEAAVRLSRYMASFGTSLYGYVGSYKSPVGMTQDPGAPGSMVPYYPPLSVWGASARGPAAGGVLWLEGGWYDSRDDRDGTRPEVPNSSLRGLVGFERQLLPDFNATVQYYVEQQLDFEAGVDPGDETRHLTTLRLEKMLRYQTVRLSLFGFWSPDDEDVYLRPVASYDVSDEVRVTVGGNVFSGDPGTLFGNFDADDSVYMRLRYSF